MLKRRLLAFVVALLAFGAKTQAAAQREPVDYVDPWIQAGQGRWFFFNASMRPYGLVNPRPETRNEPGMRAGHWPQDAEIITFGHQNGWAHSGPAIMPVTGAVDPRKGEQDWKSPYDKAGEVLHLKYAMSYTSIDGAHRNLSSPTLTRTRARARTLPASIPASSPSCGTNSRK